MKKKIKYINYFHKLLELSQQLDNYAYVIGIIDTEIERTIPVTNEIVEGIIDNIEKLYRKMKDVDISVFIESLVLENKKTQRYFHALIKETCERKNENLSKILTLNDVGLIYDNRYTQSFQKQGLMKDIFSFTRYNQSCSMKKLIEPYIYIENEEKELINPSNELLKSIWLSEAKISVEEFLLKGIGKGIWDEDYNLITKKGSIYGTDKILLASLSIALKGWAISSELDYKKIGKVFCTTFNVEINPKTDRPYKSFSSANEKYIKEFKRQFNIN